MEYKMKIIEIRQKHNGDFVSSYGSVAVVH